MKWWHGIFFFVFLFFGIFPPRTVAQTTPAIASPSAKSSIEYDLPYPGLLPGHPLYPIKWWRDRILLFFTRDQAQKSSLLLLLADKKLAMVLRLLESEKQELAAQTVGESQEHILEGSKQLITLKQKNTLPVGLAEKFDVASRKHEEILTGLEKNASTASIRERIEHARTLLNQAKQYILSVR